MSKNINTFAAGLLALTSIAAASVGCQPQASEQTAANPTEFVEQTETVDATETEAVSTFEPTEEPTEEPTDEPTEEPTADPTEEPLMEDRGVSVYEDHVLVDGKEYPLPEGTQVEEINRGRAVYIHLNTGKVLWILPVKEISFTALEACEGFGEMLVLLSKKEIIKVDKQNNLFIHHGKEIESLEGAEAFNEKEWGCVYLEDVPWEPYC